MSKIINLRNRIPTCDACDTPISDPHSTLHLKQEGGRKAFSGLHLCYGCSESIWIGIKEGTLAKHLANLPREEDHE
jgi:hypothetical protein